MTYSAERQAIEGRFASQWGSTTPIAYDNVQYDPVDNTSFVHLNILSGASTQLSIGDPTSRRFRHVGIIQISIYTPIDDGSDTARSYADTACAIFRAQSFSDIVCRAPIIDFTGEEEKWYKIIISVPFYRDELF